MYWDQSKHPKFEVSIKALVYDQDHRLLFAKDENDKWDLPGGRIDENESIEECLRREVLEELGEKVLKIIGIRYAEVIAYDDKQKRLSIGFEIDMDSKDFKPSNENVENRFVSKEEFDQLTQAYAGLKLIKDKLYS